MRVTDEMVEEIQQSLDETGYYVPSPYLRHALADALADVPEPEQRASGVGGPAAKMTPPMTTLEVMRADDQRADKGLDDVLLVGHPRRLADIRQDLRDRGYEVPDTALRRAASRLVGSGALVVTPDGLLERLEPEVHAEPCGGDRPQENQHPEGGGVGQTVADKSPRDSSSSPNWEMHLAIAKAIESTFKGGGQENTATETSVAPEPSPPSVLLERMKKAEDWCGSVGKEALREAAAEIRRLDFDNRHWRASHEQLDEEATGFQAMAESLDEEAIKLRGRERRLVEALRHTDLRLGQAVAGKPIKDMDEVRECNHALLAELMSLKGDG